MIASLHSSPESTSASTRTAVLVVDDDGRTRRIIALWCAAMQFEVCCARDGKEAMQFLLSRHFDVVLADFHMPGMRGWDLLEWMRSYRPAVTVCVMSAIGRDAAFCAEIEPHADGLLAKPFVIAALDQCVTKARGKESRKACGEVRGVELAPV